MQIKYSYGSKSVFGSFMEMTFLQLTSTTIDVNGSPIRMMIDIKISTLAIYYNVRDNVYSQYHMKNNTIMGMHTSSKSQVCTNTFRV